MIFLQDLRINNNHIENRVQFKVKKNQKISIYKTINRIGESVRQIDFRNQIEFQFSEIDSDEFDDVIENMYEITASLNGQEIGFMNFTVTYGKNDESLNELFIKLVEINDEFQGLGIGQLLYKEFGNIYTENFNQIPVSRFFINPIAEYAFRKAVSLGWVPQSALDETKIKRNYSNENEKQLWTDLRNKLPEEYRGASIIRKRIIQ